MNKISLGDELTPEDIKLLEEYQKIYNENLKKLEKKNAVDKFLRKSERKNIDKELLQKLIKEDKCTNHELQSAWDSIFDIAPNQLSFNLSKIDRDTLTQDLDEEYQKLLDDLPTNLTPEQNKVLRSIQKRYLQEINFSLIKDNSLATKFISIRKKFMDLPPRLKDLFVASVYKIFSDSSNSWKLLFNEFYFVPFKFNQASAFHLVDAFPETEDLISLMIQIKNDQPLNKEQQNLLKSTRQAYDEISTKIKELRKLKINENILQILQNASVSEEKLVFVSSELNHTNPNRILAFIEHVNPEFLTTKADDYKMLIDNPDQPMTIDIWYKCREIQKEMINHFFEDKGDSIDKKYFKLVRQAIDNFDSLPSYIKDMFIPRLLQISNKSDKKEKKRSMSKSSQADHQDDSMENVLIFNKIKTIRGIMKKEFVQPICLPFDFYEDPTFAEKYLLDFVPVDDSLFDTVHKISESGEISDENDKKLAPAIQFYNKQISKPKQIIAVLKALPEEEQVDEDLLFKINQMNSKKLTNDQLQNIWDLLNNNPIDQMLSDIDPNILVQNRNDYNQLMEKKDQVLTLETRKQIRAIQLEYITEFLKQVKGDLPKKIFSSLSKMSKDMDSQPQMLNNLLVQAASYLSSKLLEDVKSSLPKLLDLLPCCKFLDDLQSIIQLCKSKYSTKTLKIIEDNILVFISVLSSYLELKGAPPELKRDTNKALLSFFTQINAAEGNESIIRLESSLFKFAFTPDKQLPVLRVQDQFINNNDEFLSFESSTGSGKTLCVPVFYLIKSLKEKSRPFFIMTQPSNAMATEKVEFFKEHYIGAQFTSNLKTAVQAIKTTNTPTCICLSAYCALSLIQKIGEKNLSKCRFCIDEAHTRNVESDVLYALVKGKAPISVMSATPDYKAFGTPAITLPISKCFQVSIEKVIVPDDNQDKTVELTADMINRMCQDKIPLGHIVVFTNGNQYSQYVRRSLVSKKIPGVSFLDISYEKKETKESFFERLDKLIKRAQSNNHNNKLVLPLIMNGSLQPWQKSIATQPLKKYPDIIKVITSTNAIESSVTIEGLTGVVDTGLHNHAKYDQEKGVTTITVCPITKSMQTQRAGRVGRLKPGTVIQIQRNENELNDDSSPEIETCDLGQKIISLRGLGIRLESIDNLITKPDPEEFNKSLNILQKIGALDNKGNLTQHGVEISKFGQFSPLMSHTILQFGESPESRIVACYFALILSVCDSTPIYSWISDQAYKHFNEGSDLATLATALLPKLSAPKDSLMTEGYSKDMITEIYSTLKNLSYQIFPSEQKKKFVSDIKKFLTETTNINDSTDRFITLFVQNQSDEWKAAHTGVFQRFYHRLGIPHFVYRLSDGSELDIASRPLQQFYSVPSEAYIMTLKYINVAVGQKQQNSQASAIGFLLHHTPNSGSVVKHIKVADFISNDFLPVLLQHYIADKSKYKTFQLGISPSKYDPIFIFESDQLCFISDSDEEINHAIGVISKLMPFIPRSVLIHNQIVNSIIEVRNIGYGSLHTQIMLDNMLPRAYRLSNQLLNACLNNINLLANDMPLARFALSGEGLTATEDSENSEYSISMSTNTQINYVFELKSHNRLIFLVDEGCDLINQLPKNDRLQWKEGVSTHDTSHEEFIYAMRRIAPSVFNVLKSNLFFISDSSSGTVTKLNGKKNIGSASLVDMLNEYSQMYLEGYKIISDPGKIPNGLCASSGDSHFDRNDNNFWTEGKAFVVNAYTKTCLYAEHNDETKIKELASKRGLYVIPFPNAVRIDVINHTGSGLSRNQFEQKVRKVAEKFGVLIASVGSYFEGRKNFQSKDTVGCISIRVPLPEIAIALCGELRSEFLGDNITLLHLSDPNDEGSLKKIYYRYPYSRKIIDKWIKAHATKIETPNKFFDEIKPNSVLYYATKSDCDMTYQEIVKQPEDTSKNTIPRAPDDVILMSFNHPEMKAFIYPDGSDHQSEVTSHYYKCKVQQIKGILYVIRSQLSHPITRSLAGMGAENVTSIVKNQQNNCSYIFLLNESKKKELDRLLKTNCPGFPVPQSTIVSSVHEYSSRYYSNTEECRRLAQLWREEPPDLPFTVIPLVGQDIRKLQRVAKRNWYIDNSSQSMIVPNDQVKFAKQKLIKHAKQSSDNMYCIMTCDPSLPTYKSISLFYPEEDKHITQKMCQPCLLETLQFFVQDFVNDDGSIDYDRFNQVTEKPGLLTPEVDQEIQENGITWPQVPFGALMWGLVSEKTLAPYAKAWLSAIVYNRIRNTKNVFTYCPEHPEFILRVHQFSDNTIENTCKVKGCQYRYDIKSGEWYPLSVLSHLIEPRLHRCPRCKVPVIKTEGCNHITCPCGCHWCYACPINQEQGFDNPASCYDHLSKAHNGHSGEPGK